MKLEFFVDFYSNLIIIGKDITTKLYSLTEDPMVTNDKNKKFSNDFSKFNTTTTTPVSSSLTALQR